MAFTFINHFDIEATQYMTTVSGQVQVFQLVVLVAPALYQNLTSTSSPSQGSEVVAKTTYG